MKMNRCTLCKTLLYPNHDFVNLAMVSQPKFFYCFKRFRIVPRSYLPSLYPIWAKFHAAVEQLPQPLSIASNNLMCIRRIEPTTNGDSPAPFWTVYCLDPLFRETGWTPIHFAFVPLFCAILFVLIMGESCWFLTVTAIFATHIIITRWLTAMLNADTCSNFLGSQTDLLAW